MARCLPVLMIALILSGCSESASGRPTVSGKVICKGQPLAGRTLILFGTTEEGQTISQMIMLDQNGAFRGEVPAAATYKIVVQESLAVLERREPPSPNALAIPERYKQAATSDQTWDIKAGSNQKTIELTD